VQSRSLKTLAVVVIICFFASNLSSNFLPVYYEGIGLGIAGISQILLLTFLVIGLLPVILLNHIRNFERIMSLGIISTMFFFIALVYTKNPIFLGLINGLGIATFWPSFNLLQFRLSESAARARTISLFSSIIPYMTSIIGPAVGGFVIQNFGFTSLFVISIILYLAAFFCSLRMDFRPEVSRFSTPKNRIFAIFFLTFVILGISESYWVAYPLFVQSISGTVLQMGLVLALSGVVIAVVTFLINWLSDVRKSRVVFAAVGVTLNALWYFGLTLVSMPIHIVALSLLSGVAGAFSLSWFAHYGDSFRKEQYASILVLMEVGLMIGRIINLAPTNLFLPQADFRSYFMFLGAASLCLIPFYLASKKK